MGEFEFMEVLHSFARSQGYKVDSVTSSDRRNSKGAYKYVTLNLLIPEMSKNTQAEEPRKEDK